MPTAPTPHTSFLLALVAGALACGGHADRDDTPAAAARGRGPAQHDIANSSPTYVNRDGGIVITTTNGGVELGLARDTVYMGLSDSVLAKARDDMARERDGDTSGFGGDLSRFIKRTVGKALGTRIAYPVRDIQRAEYRDGRIRFTYRREHNLSFESISTEHRKALDDFNPEDARRFVAAVDSAIAADRSGP